jgi:hypothetical protein
MKENFYASLDKQDDAVFFVISWMDEYFSAGNFEAVDSVLGDLETDRMVPSVIVAALGYAWHAQQHLSNFVDFFNRCHTSLVVKVGRERADRLTDNRSPKVES